MNKVSEASAGKVFILKSSTCTATFRFELFADFLLFFSSFHFLSVRLIVWHCIKKCTNEMHNENSHRIHSFVHSICRHKPKTIYEHGEKAQMWNKRQAKKKSRTITLKCQGQFKTKTRNYLMKARRKNGENN